MKRRLIPAIVFSVLMLAIVVAAGVHILHKEAYAIQVHKIYVEMNGEPVEDVLVRFGYLNIDQEFVHENALTEGNGIAYLWANLGAGAAEWSAQVIDDRYVPVPAEEQFIGYPVIVAEFEVWPAR
ncbi:MAG: hypothetical protein FJY65_12695 [Calditrichaeota bacterium]|nr:hypothetical protein [Calditrichota bacterium]